MSAVHGVLAVVRGLTLLGLEAHEVRVEASLAPGLPVLRLIGLPDASVREAGDRVRTGLQRSGFRWPQERLVVNLAPADLPKIGAGLDLPLALAVLVATRQLHPDALRGVIACGEVGLDGRIRAVPGILPLAIGARRHGADRLVLPADAAAEAALVPALGIVPAHDLASLVEVLRRGPGADLPVALRLPDAVSEPGDEGDLREVRGQPVARRAIELAAIGGHHVLLSGPPGCGKTMLAHRLHQLLPALDPHAALEVAAIASVAGERAPGAPLPIRPPRREPHHRVSIAGLIGGGSGVPRPGELTLAHRGVLLMDELLEAPRPVLDALRQPLERGRVELVRARARVTYPAHVQLVAATNPCPCGFLGHPTRSCRCRPDQVQRYRARLSGPLLDRIDVQVAVEPVDPDALLGAADGESTAVVAARVAATRAATVERNRAWMRGRADASPLGVAAGLVGGFGPSASTDHAGSVESVGPDGAIPWTRDLPTDVLRHATSAPAMRALSAGVAAVGGSARSFDRALRLARTIADLAAAESVGPDHVAEALAYRLPPTEID